MSLWQESVRYTHVLRSDSVARRGQRKERMLSLLEAKWTACGPSRMPHHRRGHTLDVRVTTPAYTGFQLLFESTVTDVYLIESVDIARGESALAFTWVMNTIGTTHTERNF